MVVKVKDRRKYVHFGLIMASCLIIVGSLPLSFIFNYFPTVIIMVEAQEEPSQSLPQSSGGGGGGESSTSSPSAQILGQSLEDVIRPYVGYITFAIDVSAGIIIGISAIMGLISFLKILRKPLEQQTQDKETIRLRLARGMLLALDFEVGSDILKTVLVPSVRELTILAVVVGIRIVLSWSLSKEISRHADIKAGQSGKTKLAFKTAAHEDSDSNDNNNNSNSEPPSESPQKSTKQKQDTHRSSSADAFEV
jgi:uncharacterized membrane protein